MKQQVEVTVKITLWVNADLNKEGIKELTKGILSDKLKGTPEFDEIGMKNQIEVLNVKEEAEIFDNS